MSRPGPTPGVKATVQFGTAKVISMLRPGLTPGVKVTVQSGTAECYEHDHVRTTYGLRLGNHYP